MVASNTPDKEPPVKDHLIFVAKVVIGVVIARYVSDLINRFTAPKAV